MQDKHEIVGHLISNLVQENILPCRDQLKIYIPDTLLNRNVAFNQLYLLGLNINDSLIIIEDSTIAINLEYATSSGSSITSSQKIPTTCYIMNKNYELLSKDPDKADNFFSSTPEYAIPFLGGLAQQLVKKKEYSKCFVIDVLIQPEEKEPQLKLLQFLLQSKRITI